ncbi:MAG: ABC transporter ATP-binding protein, partial [Rhodospirillaceae bacterium]|nr:ABC transporter ATP-binding protein [Rhodospirillaceae bacterium]
DEPTNHLDVDAREALVQALNAYSGAVIIVSHDRHLLELTADRLVYVADGTAKEFPGTLDDYQDLVMGRGPAIAKSSDSVVSDNRAGKSSNKKEQRRAAAQQREQNKSLRQAVTKAEAEMSKLSDQRSAIDQALFKPTEASGPFKDKPTSDLMKIRADVDRDLVGAEARWLKASEALEQAGSP